MIVDYAVKSKTFRVGDWNFRLDVYPRGKFQSHCLSFFIEAIEDLNSSTDSVCSMLYLYRLFVLEMGKPIKDSLKRSS